MLRREECISEISYIPRKVDLCVVGAGSAALSTAIAARELGVDVLLIEKAPKEEVGGDLRYCGIIRAVTPEYSEEDFFGDLMRLSRNLANKELIRIMVNKSKEMIDWLTNMGLKWQSRTPVLYRPEGGCYMMLVKMLSFAKKQGIKIVYETKATELLIDDFGNVNGLKIQKKGDKFRDINCKAAVLACGGFSANPEMICKYIDRYADTMIVRGSKYNTGEGIVMADKIGAKVAFMGEFHGAPEHRDAPRTDGGGCTIQPYTMGVWINLNGRRFLDEGKETYVKVGKSIFAQPGNTAYLLFDETIKNRKFKDSHGVERETIADRLKVEHIDPDLPEDLLKLSKNKRSLGDVYYKADTIIDLAEMIGIPPLNLKQTIEEYNDNIQEKEGLVGTPCVPNIFPPKSGWAYPIKEPPYYAYPAVCGITLTFGGLVISDKGEVVNKEGNIIPNLYAVGALTSGFFYYDYEGGSALTRNVVFGRITGKNAAEHIKNEH